MDRAGLIKFFGKGLKTTELPKGGPVLSVGRAELHRLMDDQGLGLKQAIKLCLEHDIWPERFRPNRGSFSAAQQAKLLESSVAVIGCGGLGGHVITELVRLGVGRLSVCDGDAFDESNLNRQALSSIPRLGTNKARAARDEAAQLNPAVEVVAHDYWATESNLPEIIAGVAVVVDCLDNLAFRYVLEESSHRMGLPFVHGALAGFEGFVMTVNPGDPGLKGLYGAKAVDKKDSAETMLGVPTLTPAVVATMQAMEVVKLLLGWPGLTGARALHIDLAEPAMEVLRLA